MEPQIRELLPERRNVSFRKVGKEVLIRDAETSQVHFLNPAGSIVWECCDGKTALDDCEARLRAAFVIPAQVDLVADIRETIADLDRKGLLHG